MNRIHLISWLPPGTTCEVLQINSILVGLIKNQNLLNPNWENSNQLANGKRITKREEEEENHMNKIPFMDIYRDKIVVFPHIFF